MFGYFYEQVMSVFGWMYLADEDGRVIQGLRRNFAEPQLGTKGGSGNATAGFLQQTQQLGPPRRRALLGGEQTRSAFRCESTGNKQRLISTRRARQYTGHRHLGMILQK